MNRVIVLGSGIAGLLIAKIVSDVYDEVIVLERDEDPCVSAARIRVPQAKHTHLLLSRGAQIMNELFPTMLERLEASGAVRLKWGRENAIYLSDGQVASYEGGLVTHLCTRQLLERVLRQLVVEIANVTVEYQVEAEIVHDGGAVDGVRIEGRMLEADLVVDATGRSTTIKEQLSAWGYGLPESETIDAGIRYTTAYLKPPTDTSIKQIVIPPLSDHPRGGALSLVETGEWAITLTGYGATEAPPAKPEQFIEFAKTLHSSALYETIKECDMPERVYRYMRLQNSWARYDKMVRFPNNLLIVGDAICTFNPIYGQGMTVAAMSADRLRKLFDQYQPDEAVNLFRKKSADIIKVAWLYATGNDRKFTAHESAWHRRIPQMYLNRVIRSTSYSGYTAKVVSETMNFRRPFYGLFAPRVMASVVWMSYFDRKKRGKSEMAV